MSGLAGLTYDQFLLCLIAAILITATAVWIGKEL